MSRFEKIVDEDHQVKKIKLDAGVKTMIEDMELDKQKEIVKEGKPIPVLSLGKQIQSTAKDVKKVEAQKEMAKTQINESLLAAINKRKEELAKEYPKEYKEHLKQKELERLREEMKTNSQNISRNRGR
jgi:hypothetical protein